MDQQVNSGFAARIVHYFRGHPKGFWFIFWGELAERSSYYGMRAILLYYMIERLGFTKPDASEYMSLFIAAAYFFPLIGGYVADNYFGKYWTIVGFSLPYILGHVILGFESTVFLVIALTLLSMGTGVIKPNISTLMGMTYDQQRPGKDQMRSDAFAMFYFAINTGAAASQSAMPLLRDSLGYSIAFLFPAALMVISFTFFAMGKRHYAVEIIKRRELPPEQTRQVTISVVIFSVVVVALAGLIGFGFTWLVEQLGKEILITSLTLACLVALFVLFWIVFDAQQRLVLRRVSAIFALIAFFWSIFDQSTTTWTLFAEEHCNLNVFGWIIKPDQIQAANSYLVLILLPIITIAWRVIHWRPTTKMLVGFFLTAACMGVMAIAGYTAVQSGERVSLLWEILAYIVITIAEVLVSVVGLELAFTVAPKRMKSFVTACFLLAVFLGNVLNARISPYYSKEDSSGVRLLNAGEYFLAMTLMMLAVTVVFVFVARWFNRVSPSWQKEAAQEEAQASAS